MSGRAPRAAKTAAKALLDSQKSSGAKAAKSSKPLTASFKASKKAEPIPTKVVKQKTNVSKLTKKDIILKQVVEEAVNGETAGVTTYSSGDVTDELPTNRPTNPSISNAPIRTGSSKTVTTADPSIADPTTATASDFLQKAISHICTVDPVLKPICTRHFCHVFSDAGLAEPVDPFRSLVSGIISQQVSGAAARSIKQKFINLFDPPVEFPTPKQCLDTPIETLRTAGLSQRKAEYVQSLAEKFESGELSTEFLLTATDEEVTERLVSARGIGLWSAEMFLLFALKRGDIFSIGDLGIQRGMAAYAGRDVNKLKNGGKGKWKYMTGEEMLERSERFRPYRSVFMWYMWRYADTDVQSMEI